MDSRVLVGLCAVDSGASGVLPGFACFVEKEATATFSEWNALLLLLLDVTIEATLLKEIPDGVTNHGAAITFINNRDCFQLRGHAPTDANGSCQFEWRTLAAFV